MTLQFLALTLPTLDENLALDEALLLEAETEATKPILRLWEWSRSDVVLGAAGIIADDVNLATCDADGVSLHRRSSGGGTVLLGPGCLVYSLVLPYSFVEELSLIEPSYRYVLCRVSAALDVGVPITHRGSSDLVLDGKKFSGNSQRRKREHLLHHGTILYDFDLDKIERYLLVPPRQPEYRQNRRHQDFTRNLPLSQKEVIARLRRGWDANEELKTYPKGLVEQLVSDKFGKEEWIRRR